MVPPVQTETRENDVNTQYGYQAVQCFKVFQKMFADES
jgi:hypothetical protein